MPLIPESTTVDVPAVEARFKLDEAEAGRVLDLALAELARATETVWREVPEPIWDDWIIRTCGAIVAAKKRPTAGSSQGTSADQAQPRPAGPREYLAPLRNELAHYTDLAIG
jgi:hypothetical protein